jgi:hypothetical protein
MTRRRREQQGGFALLMVFVMAAGVALFLYAQLPRTAFESMRGKEELLVDHATQYQRAIQLYVAKFQKYPQNLDDLEKTSNIRFLRRRFKNPFTGKDDWRLIHVDNAGRLTDSLVEKKEEKKPNQNTFITEMAGIGQTPTFGEDSGVNVALRKRPSEGGDPSGNNGMAPLPLPSTGYQSGPFPGPQQQQQVPNPLVDPNNPQAQLQQQMQQQLLQQQGQQPGMPQGQMPIPAGQAQAPGQVPPNQVNPNNPNLNQMYPNGVPQYPGQPNPGVNPQTGMRYPGGVIPGQPPNPYGQTAPMGQQQQQAGTNNPYAQPQAPYGQPPNPYGQPQQQPGQQPTYPTQPTTGTPGTPNFGNNAPNAALDSIRQALTSPSPNMPMNLAPGLQIMGGLAGIAPKNEGPAIRVINEQTNYKKWEFVYDMKKDKRLQQAVGAQQNQINQTQQNLQGQSGMNGQGGFGSQSGFGSQNGLGSQGGFGGQRPGFGNQQPVGYGPGSPTGAQQPGMQPQQPQQPPMSYPNPFGRR